MSPVVADPSLVGLLRDGEAALAAAGIGPARVEAEWLLASVLGMGRFGAYLAGRGPTRAETERYRELIGRRSSREPLQHLLGFEDFCGLRLAVSPEVLIPRPETEGLVAWALEGLAHDQAATVADVGTGSAAIACALATARGAIRVWATDRSPAALEVARANVASLGLADRVGLLEGDLVEPLVARGMRVDLLVANLPYVPDWAIPTLAPEVALHEPRGALCGGIDGMALIERLIADAPRVLGAGARLLLEVGPGQAGLLSTRLLARGFEAVEVRRDLGQVDRYVGARWPTAGRGR